MQTVAWPDPASIPIDSKQRYDTPDGKFIRVTKVLKVLGLSTEALVRWSAGVEREAVLHACEKVYAPGFATGLAFAAAVEAQIGPARQHQKQMAEAANIGTAIHAAIHNMLRAQLELPIFAPADATPGEVQWAIMAFEDWWKSSGLKAVRMEQPVWDKELGYAGTIDLIAEHPVNGLGIIDFKSSKAIYDDHHLQVAAYLHAANNFADVRWAEIVRLPKNTNDPKFEVKPLGAMYNRQLNREQLLDAFRCALGAWKLLIA